MKGLEDFDKIDRKILFELDQNARQSFAELGRKVRLGSDLVRYRVERLYSLGVIHNCSALVDLHRLGFTQYKVYLKLDPGSFEGVFEYLDQAKHTYWLAALYGKWDAVYHLAAKNVREVHDILQRVFRRFPGAILSYTVCIVVERVRYPKKYLVSRAATTGRITGDVRENGTLDKIDQGVLFHLSRDARASGAELARKLGTTPAVIDYRIRKLEKQGIIGGYWVQFHYEKLNLLFLKITLQPKNFDPSEGKRFQDFCRRNQYITCFITQLGEPALECEAEVPSLRVLDELIREMMSEFRDFIGTLDYLFIRSERPHRVPVVEGA